MNVKKMVLDASRSGIAISALKGITSDFGVDPKIVASSIMSLVGDGKIDYVDGVITAKAHTKVKEIKEIKGCKEYTFVHSGKHVRVEKEPEVEKSVCVNPFDSPVDTPFVDPLNVSGIDFKSKGVVADTIDAVDDKPKSTRQRSGHPIGYIERCVREEITRGPIGKNDTAELALKYDLTEITFRKGLYRLKANGSITGRKTDSGYVFHSNWVRNM